MQYTVGNSQPFPELTKALFGTRALAPGKSCQSLGLKTENNVCRAVNRNSHFFGDRKKLKEAGQILPSLPSTVVTHCCIMSKFQVQPPASIHVPNHVSGTTDSHCIYSSCTWMVVKKHLTILDNLLAKVYICSLCESRAWPEDKLANTFSFIKNIL